MTSQSTDVRPLLINTSDTGGSATATRRIHEGLREIGVDSRMLVQQKDTDDPTIEGPEGTVGQAWSLARPHVDMLPARVYGRSDKFAVNWLPERMNERIEEIDPDVVHLNWVWRGAMSIRSIGQIDRPIVWRLPDMTAMTGGCNYADGCEKFHDRCGDCPQLQRSHERDLSRLNWHRKRRHWEELDLTIVAPSTWLAEQAEQSSLFGDCRIEVIPNCLDTELYSPRDPELGRELFDLPEDKRLVLFGAVDPMGDHRKGADLLQGALQELADDWDGEEVELVIFGSDGGENPPDFGFPATYVGYLHDDQSLAMLYSAADVMVVPSRYEGFGQTVFEALSCGTPVVAFDATGPADQIEHSESGYLAQPYSTTDLADGINQILDGTVAAQGDEASEGAAASQFNQYRIASRYYELYSDIL